MPTPQMTSVAPQAAPWPPEGYTERTVDVSGRTVRYLEAGDGPPLVMIHGGGGLIRELGAAHTALAAAHRVLAVELPGWGHSHGEGIGSMDDLAGVVAGFAEELGVTTYSVLGTSFGAGVALRMAIEYPDRIRTLVLEAPAAFREGVPGPREIPPFAPDGTPIPRPDPAQVAYMEKVSGPPTDPELVARMPSCPVPTLVLLGTADRLFPPRFAADYKRLPVSTVALVYGAGHNIKGDRPEAFLSIVEDFLRRGPTFVISESSTLIHE